MGHPCTNSLRLILGHGFTFGILSYDYTFNSKVSKRYVSKETAATIHKKAEAFLTWLREAEEESEDDEDEHEDVAIVYTNKPVEAEEDQTEEAEEDDGLDIDAI